MFFKLLSPQVECKLSEAKRLPQVCHPSSLRVQYNICHTEMCSIFFFWNK